VGNSTDHFGAAVTPKAHPLDPAFIERQRQALTRLRAELLTATKDDENEEAAVNDQGAGGAREYEDDAQKLDMLELEGNLVVRDVARLERVDRALKKIADGTYGSSDTSGELIPRERLEAIPESIYTLAEEQAREQKAQEQNR
jgi:DnaK suppressor protein